MCPLCHTPLTAGHLRSDFPVLRNFLAGVSPVNFDPRTPRRCDGPKAREGFDGVLRRRQTRRIGRSRPISLNTFSPNWTEV
eukprot:200408-Pleurochrysis_carterae.AAC.2